LFKILAISGSLRAASLNGMLLRAVQRLAPSDIHVDLYRGLGALPPFNQDLEAVGPPDTVVELRTRIISAQSVLIAAPEYAHGVAGVIKNALDWMVGNESFIDKPVGLLNASPRASIAQAALRETLITMSARVVPAACVTVGILGSGLDEEGINQHGAVRGIASAAIGRAIDGSRSYRVNLSELVRLDADGRR